MKKKLKITKKKIIKKKIKVFQEIQMIVQNF